MFALGHLQSSDQTTQMTALSRIPLKKSKNWCDGIEAVWGFSGPQA